jgi:hypothetical protein
MYMQPAGLGAFDWEAMLTKGADIVETARRVQTALKQPKAPKVVTVQAPAPTAILGMSPLQLGLAALAGGAAIYFMTRKRGRR